MALELEELLRDRAVEQGRVLRERREVGLEQCLAIGCECELVGEGPLGWEFGYRLVVVLAMQLLGDEI